MKLKNKKTGEIHEITQAVFLSDNMNKKFAIYSESEGHNYAYKTLAELNEEWEDYEESKEYWYINEFGTPTKADFVGRETLYDKCRKNFGNYFETEEEAEKAVEKLRAYKRLKDKGFRFTAWYGGSKNISYEITNLENETYIPRQTCDDLDLLFGGEE